MAATCPATMAASSPGALPINLPRWAYSTSSLHSSWSTDGPFLSVCRRVICLAFANRGYGHCSVDLRANLKHLRISANGTVPSNAQSTYRSMPINTFLQHVVRQGYFDRVRLGDTKSMMGKHRGQVSATQGSGDTEENLQAYEWRWGNRAHGEVGEQDVRKLSSAYPKCVILRLSVWSGRHRTCIITIQMIMTIQT
jgi:hypothetical protein